MSVVFHHKRNMKNGVVHALGGATVAMEELPHWILPTLELGEFITKKVGVAVCSEEDRYCKKTGKDLALSRMKPTKLTVESILHTNEFSLVTLVDESGSSYLLKKYPNTKSIFLLGFVK